VFLPVAHRHADRKLVVRFGDRSIAFNPASLEDTMLFKGRVRAVAFQGGAKKNPNLFIF